MKVLVYEGSLIQPHEYPRKPGNKYSIEECGKTWTDEVKRKPFFSALFIMKKRAQETNAATSKEDYIGIFCTEGADQEVRLRLHI